VNVLRRFPAFELRREDQNPAIRLFGRRFYHDQTPIEYLAEFLLVFASPKIQEDQHRLCFPMVANSTEVIEYWPEDRLALKYFAFFASSKLDTRHPVHMEAYREALGEVKTGIRTQQEKDQEFAVRLLQSLFSGFVGVAKHRTWATHTFFPASEQLLSREIGWRHTEAKHKDLRGWDDSQRYFDTGSHNFMARGGELLYLQLLNLFSEFGDQQITVFVHDQAYTHLRVDGDLRPRLENALSGMLQEVDKQLARLVRFVESRLNAFRLSAMIRPAALGWVPKDTLPEALLFAWEMLNICSSSQSPLQKVALLETLCCMHVLRSLCFQSRRLGGDHRGVSHLLHMA
jgi:hypothetical protein